MELEESSLVSEVLSEDPVRVLLVEDNPADVDLLEAYLEGIPDRSFELTSVDRLEEGFNAANRTDFDLLMLDLNLPDAAAEESSRSIGLFPSDLPVIVLTGMASVDLEINALDRGAQEFLQKDGLTSEILERCIAHAVERNRIFDALRRRERQLRKYKIAIDESPAVVLMKDLDHRYELVNPTFEELTGIPAEEAVGATAEELFGEEVGEETWRREERVIETGAVVRDEEIHDFAGRERVLNTVRVPYRDEEGELAGIITVARDVTERVEMRERLERRAFLDELTGLPNRALFRDRLVQVIERAKRRGERFGVAVVDVDDFHAINDSLGHEVADEALCRIGERLGEVVAPEDTVARFGADEFGCIFGDIQERSDLEEIGERLKEVFTEPISGFEADLHVVISTGFAFVDGTDVTEDEAESEIDAVSRTAFRANREAKKTEGTAWEIYDRSNWGEGSRRIQRSNRIRAGLKNGEFLPFYQPVYHLQTDELLALEVLARWDRPGEGLLEPGEFIPLAEETGLISELGREVVRRACTEMGEIEESFEEGGGVQLLVNLSSRQFDRSGLAAELIELIDHEAPEWVGVDFEITESDILRHRSNALELREAGHEIWVDDFGAGYSSLSRIKQIPIDGLKLDMEFVHGVTERSEDGAIVYTIVELGRRLGVPVIAEGVETSGQYEFLKETNCTGAQGFLFAHPQPVHNLSVVFEK